MNILFEPEAVKKGPQPAQFASIHWIRPFLLVFAGTNSKRITRPS